MNKEEKDEFTDFVTDKVNLIINDAVAKQNKHIANNFAALESNIANRLEVTLPNVMKALSPRHPILFSVMLSAVEGLFIGLAIYLAMNI